VSDGERLAYLVLAADAGLVGGSEASARYLSLAAELDVPNVSENGVGSGLQLTEQLLARVKPSALDLRMAGARVISEICKVLPKEPREAEPWIRKALGIAIRTKQESGLVQDLDYAADEIEFWLNGISGASGQRGLSLAREAMGNATRK
jgi:hypothetical protein